MAKVIETTQRSKLKFKDIVPGEYFISENVLFLKCKKMPSMDEVAIVIDVLEPKPFLKRGDFFAGFDKICSLVTVTEIHITKIG